MISLSIAQLAYWTGAVSTCWETAGNWSCNRLPNTDTDVLINSGTVIIHSNVAIRSFAKKRGVIVTAEQNAVLTILH